jgi:putative heme-binding domain-containing protein
MLDTQSAAAQRTALLALARVGQPTDQPRILEGLLQHDWSGADEAGLLVLLRSAQLTLIRQGGPFGEEWRQLLGRLSEHFPNRSFAVNWLLAELLVKLESPLALSRILDLLESAVTQEEQFQYAKTLARVSAGWDDERARRIVEWFERSRGLHGGKLVESGWLQLRGELSERLQAAGVDARAAELLRVAPMVAGESLANRAVRPVVQQWQLEQLLDDVQTLRPETRSVEAGERALAVANCLQCHRWGDRGGHTGPDLTDVSKRFDGRALLESILEPSRQVDPKYLNPAFLLDDGRVVTGRAVGVNDRQLVIEVDPLSGRSETIDRRSIESTTVSPVSPMPAGLLDILTRDEILDLIALLRR